jgi:FixJ family two-component response regulator
MEAAELGAVEYLQKPVPREELIRVVEKCLRIPPKT